MSLPIVVVAQPPGYVGYFLRHLRGCAVAGATVQGVVAATTINMLLSAFAVAHQIG
jgi:hypothetical protein